MSKDQAMMNSIVNTVQQTLKYYQTALCTEGKQCNQICANKECKAHAILCADDACKCFQPHSDSKICTLVYPRLILKKIEKKTIEPPQFLKFIDVTLQKLIDQFTSFREKLKEKVQEGLSYTGKIRNFLQISKKGQFEQLTGQIVGKVLEQLNEQDNKSKESFEKSLQTDIKCEWCKVQKSIKQQIFSLEKVINQFASKDPFQWTFQDSKVLSYYDQRKRLVQFFPQDKRKFKAKLLYRASENDFLVEDFQNKCCGIADTVTLVKTQFNKVIGGYTPLTWKGKAVDNCIYQQDSSKESFIFSVTNKDKFPITPGINKQIAHHKYHGPVFCNNNGCYDLIIKDKADRNNSLANIGYGYSNPKYKQDDDQSWKMFSGDYHFRIFEWQVYQLTF